MTKFSETAWAETSGLYERIMELPFNRELADGSLSERRFRFYMIQDALYLEQYARALAMASAMAPEADAVQFFARAAEQALVVERSLHEGFFEKFGIDPKEAAAAAPSPTCYAYTNFLLAVSLRGGYGTLAAALLPCFWVYWKIGNHIARTAGKDNPYREWIDTYADPAFGEAVDTLIGITDRTAAAAALETRDAMLRAFKRSVQFEWMFWDSAYRLEDWPVVP